MRVVLAVAVIVFAVACGPAGAETQTTEARRAHLVIVSTDPLVVRGLRFEPGERVKLLVTAGGRAAPMSAARASSAGRFTARLGRTVAAREALVVQAIGSRGSRAMADISAPTGTLVPSP
jgi:hypothetical protein